MITKYEVLINFPKGAKFISNPDLYVYKKILDLIKNTTCLSRISKCKDCPINKECTYFKVAGENFKGYPAIFLNVEDFYKKSYKNNEEKYFIFYIIGNKSYLGEYVNILFEYHLNNILLNNYYLIKHIKSIELNNDYIEVDELRVKTLVETTDIKEAINKMFNYYNDKYMCDFKKVECDIKFNKHKKISKSIIGLNTKKIRPIGYVGEIQKKISIYNSLFEIGIGKYNFIGGGKLEIKN